MHSTTSQAEMQSSKKDRSYRAVILRAGIGGHEVLLARNGGGFELPLLIIATGKRVAQEATEFTRYWWGLQTVCLFQQASTTSAGDDTTDIVLESRDEGFSSPGFHWISQTYALRHLVSALEIRSLQTALKNVSPTAEAPFAGPFARVGWFDDLLPWIEQQISPFRLRLTGRFRQLNGDSSFSLIRFETSGPSVWFKAVGEPNAHEFAVTVALAKLFRSYLPTLIGTGPKWNGWLTFEVDGSALDESCGIASWEKTAQTLATLQVESTSRTQELLRIPCHDIRVATLIEQVEPFFDRITELMARQSKVPPRALSRDEVSDLACKVKKACCHLAEIGVPDAIGHMDFNPGNVIVGPERTIFLDWAEAYVGHPFFTYEYFREHFFRMHPSDALARSRLTASYLEPWSGVNSRKLVGALQFTPLIAAFAYAAGNGTWRDAPRLESSHVAGYLRSMTRRMQREASLTQARGYDV
jgi:hypothetical protein